MRRAPGQSLRLGVSAHAVSLVRVGRWRWAGAGRTPTLLAEHAFSPAGAAPPDAIAGALREMLGRVPGAALAGWPLDIVLADELTRLWQVAPPQGATRLSDIEAAAALRFQTLYGESPSAWRLMAEWDSRYPFFAAAAPRALLAALEQVAAEHKLAIVGIAPHFVGAWNRWRGGLKAGAWFGLAHDNLLTLGALQDKRLRAVRALAVPHGADHYWITQMLTREALLLGLDAPSLLQLCGTVPAAWTAPPSNAAHIACVALEPAPALDADWSSIASLARGGSGA
ncbi:hypothetical protein [Rugamonas sp.]|uniref:hypothetical protein n=1 Tax=Rugamonas sp. TaxID=1926287 RepID=UPI0025D75F5B|nr:hypothetical protein [Rugamonas sp.]